MRYTELFDLRAKYYVLAGVSDALKSNNFGKLSQNWYVFFVNSVCLSYRQTRSGNVIFAHYYEHWRVFKISYFRLISAMAITMMTI